jgi:hypothetical protein
VCLAKIWHAFVTKQIDGPGMGWQSNDWISCFVGGMFSTRDTTPSVPWNGLPFQVRAEVGR